MTDWIEVTVKTTGDGLEPVTGIVLMAGISGLIVDDPKDIEAYLAGPQATRWDYVDESLLLSPDREAEVRFFVGDNAQGLRQWDGVQDAIRVLKDSDIEGLFGSLDWSLRHVREEDWANNWKAFFKPFPVGKKLVVKPTWENWDKGDKRIILEIDPGSSFGTGQHHTTRMCLELMEDHVRPRTTVLDIGCGSGILMIAALLLGAGFAIGVDVDEYAVKTAEDNLKQNGFGADRFSVLWGDLTADGVLRERLGGSLIPETAMKADLITANIVADVIIAMTPYFLELLAPEGKLLVSGVIDGRREDVLQYLAGAGFALTDERTSGEWLALLLERAPSIT